MALSGGVLGTAHGPRWRAVWPSANERRVQTYRRRLYISVSSFGLAAVRCDTLQMVTAPADEDERELEDEVDYSDSEDEFGGESLGSFARRQLEEE